MVTLILPCVAFVQVLAVDTPAVKARTACPVSIEVGGTELLSSCSVDPTIESGGAELIYIPTHPPRGFIVERLDPETVPGTRFEPVFVSVTKRYFAGYPPELHDFTERRIFALDWCKVGEPRPDGIEGCVIPPGVYRVSMLYSLADLRKGPGRARELCRAFSPAFRLKDACSYITFHSDTTTAKPNHPLQPPADGRCGVVSPVTFARRG